MTSQKVGVVNLFELSKNFHSRGPAWLVERYIQQQQPLPAEAQGYHGYQGYPQTPAPTSAQPQVTTGTSGQNTTASIAENNDDMVSHVKLSTVLTHFTTSSEFVLEPQWMILLPWKLVQFSLSLPFVLFSNVPENISLPSNPCTCTQAYVSTIFFCSICS